MHDDPPCLAIRIITKGNTLIGKLVSEMIREEMLDVFVLLDG